MRRSGSFVVAIGATLSLATAAAAQSDSLVVDSTGRVGVGTATPQQELHVVGEDAQLLVEDLSTAPPQTDRYPLLVKGTGARVRFGIGRIDPPGQLWTFDNAGESFRIGKAGTGVTEFNLDSSGNVTITGTLSEGSSRGSKTGISRVDVDAILEDVISLPVLEWRYKSDPANRHVGPMAEDWHEAFGLSDGSTIASADAQGIALAAIQGLYQMLQEKDARIQRLASRLEKLETESRKPRRGLADTVLLSE